jgi:hypothetical protein
MNYQLIFITQEDDEETAADCESRVTMEPCLEVRFRKDPYNPFYPGDRVMWRELFGGEGNDDILYLRREKDTVRTLKIVLSACFMVDVAADNIELRVLQENIPGSGYHFPVTLIEDDAVLGLHPAVKENMVWIWVSKKVDYDMWNFLEHKIDRSISRKERLDHEEIMIDTMLLVEDNWLKFVLRNFEVITDILEYTLTVWLEGGEKEKFMQKEYESSTKDEIAQMLEMRKSRFEHLRMTVIQRQVLFETETNISDRENRLHELYFNGNDPRSI